MTSTHNYSTKFLPLPCRNIKALHILIDTCEITKFGGLIFKNVIIGLLNIVVSKELKL